MMDKRETFDLFNLGKEHKRQFRLLVIQHDDSITVTFTKKLR